MRIRFYFLFFCSLLFILSCEETEGSIEPPLVQVQINFEQSRSTIFAGDTIQYFDKSTGDPLAWDWEFGGGNPSTSNEQNPFVIYPRAGSYSVYLKASNGDHEAFRRKFDFAFVRDLKESPYSGTVWMESNIITSDDPTTYESIEFDTQEVREIYDRRVDQWLEINVFVYEATFEGGQTVDMQVNPEFSRTDAETYAIQYAKLAGQLPKSLFKELKSVSVHDGDASFGGGIDGDIQVYVEAGENAIQSGHIEELMLHEVGHVALQDLHSDPAWLAAVRADPTYISSYAGDFPSREDISESIVPYFAFRYRSDQIPEEMSYIISRIMPNRIKFFDAQGFDWHPLE